MSSVRSPLIARSTVVTSWRWMWPDILMRIVPLTAIPFLYITIFHLPPSFLGLTLRNVPQQIALGVLVGLLMAIFAAIYRMIIIGPWFRWPTVNDHLLQGAYYLIVNGPVEELFFRGFLLTAVTQWTGWIVWGWLVSVLTYTLYHRLGRWKWRSIGGVGLAGIVFSLLYLLQPDPHSLLTVAIVHGFTTSGFLSWGDELLYRRWQYRQDRMPRDNS
ncbi:MAG: CPBP family intramembrane metalloprotease [Chloroflexi bacterium]|nr:MAG: CPBP family intramembrane metalloprotease [Chloroflexota bacterium]